MTIRRYLWQTERAKEQSHFLSSIVKVYKTYTKGDLPELINFGPQTVNAGSNGELRSLIRAGVSLISNVGSVEGRRPSFTPSSPPAHANLVPPPSQPIRSVSSSSVASGGTPSRAQPVPHHPQLRNRPSSEAQSSPRAESFSRSPPAESSLAGSRRPSSSDLDPRAVSPSNAQHHGIESIGRGPPPNQRGKSHDRLGQGSATSEYQEPVGNTFRKLSSETIRPIEDVGRSNRPSSRNGHDLQKTPVMPRTQMNGTSNSESQPKIPPEDQNHQLAPTITTTLPSPSVPQEPTLPAPANLKIQRRASFHPPPLKTAFSREVLLTSLTGLLPGAVGQTVEDRKGSEDAIMNNVEEMLDGFDWTASTGFGENGRKKGSADAIEGRLQDELTALDSVSTSIKLVDTTSSRRPISMRSSNRMTGLHKCSDISTRLCSSWRISTCKSRVIACSSM